MTAPLPAEAAYMALFVSSAATIFWILLLTKMISCEKKGVERRPYLLAMPVVGIVASIGTLASAIGFAYQIGAIELRLSGEALTLVASMGRGALLMGGIISLVYYHPPKTKQ